MIRISKPYDATVSTETNKVLDRALAVLRQFALRPTGYTVPELSAHLGMSKTTTRRFLQTLAGQGFLDYDADRQRYTLGMLILSLSTGLSQQNTLTVAVQPVLEALQRDSAETASLWIRVRLEAMCLSSVESSQFIRAVSPIGRSIPLYAGCHGKQLLAGMEDAELEDYLRVTELTPLTSATITERTALTKELDRIRADGFSASRGEVNIDGAGVAAPITNPAGRIIACLSITAPAHRLSDERFQAFVPLVRGAASDASGRMFGPRPARVQ
jgi:IclR family acetate operon transcriptional repressor